mgnify:CR=1 FL=1
MEEIISFEELVSVLRMATYKKAKALVDGRYSPNYGSKLLDQEALQLFNKAHGLAIKLDQKFNTEKNQ